ncbi:unnamed protein product [Lampetra planeri]
MDEAVSSTLRSSGPGSFHCSEKLDDELPQWGSEPSSALFPFCYLSAGQRRASTPATELGAATNPTRACNLRSTPRAKINHRSAAAFASHRRAGKVSQRFTRVTGARARSYAARGDRERARSP